MKLGVDANIVIYAIETNSSLHAEASGIFRDASSKGYELHSSELTFLEVLAKSHITDAEAMEFYERVRLISNYNWPIDTNVLLKAAELRRNYQTLKTPDAIHLATALIHACGFFVTNDTKLLKLKLAGLKIISPRNINRLAP